MFSQSPDAHGPTGLDLELLFWAALVWSCRCPSVRFHTAPPPTPHLLSLLHLCLKNTFLDTHKPSIPLPDPTEMHISVLKPCFSTVNCLEKDRCLCPFLIFHSWGGERTIADVNTGNDTNEQIGNKKKKESKLLAWNELVIAGVFSQCENSQLR